MEHEPLLPPGIHDITEDQLDNHFLSSFSTSTTRQPLINGLKSFIAFLRKLGIPCEMWIDGSFTTNKVDPNDIDLVVFASESDVNQLDSDKQLLLANLIDRASSKRRFGCDVLFAVAEDFEMRSYWRGWYGFDRQERPKGVAKIMVTS
ncbi:hypothetical protein SAMN02745119_00235 [Trichlorobacter thiogenes]|uniref:Polymerase nucleotidyl transferase domain-containing protein n=1 Tax=Trichlorobacter thiogenes TaxID=115783 RepID=A0A1T4K0W9_9BACT|nr:hypothetical protein [Trichlorobacter thiogenes]SJZ36034.1 hypothetical protein SAMN02745119_00235 [Trichlorobacter thiogenes]